MVVSPASPSHPATPPRQNSNSTGQTPGPTRTPCAARLCSPPLPPPVQYEWIHVETHVIRCATHLYYTHTHTHTPTHTHTHTHTHLQCVALHAPADLEHFRLRVWTLWAPILRRGLQGTSYTPDQYVIYPVCIRNIHSDVCVRASMYGYMPQVVRTHAPPHPSTHPHPHLPPPPPLPTTPTPTL